jgi:hypothetical protein
LSSTVRGYRPSYSCLGLFATWEKDHIARWIGVNEKNSVSLESALLNKIFAENQTLFGKQFSHNSTLLNSDFGV